MTSDQEANIARRSPSARVQRQMEPGDPGGELHAPAGTMLVTFLFLLAIAALWFDMYLWLLETS